MQDGRKDHAPENLNILQKIALALLRAAPDPRPSGKKKMTGPKRRFAASMNPEYMATVIFKKQIQEPGVQGRASKKRRAKKVDRGETEGNNDPRNRTSHN
jgi:hypothetical protein